MQVSAIVLLISTTALSMVFVLPSLTDNAFLLAVMMAAEAALFVSTAVLHVRTSFMDTSDPNISMPEAVRSNVTNEHCYCATCQVCL
jgi:hypothetical protein